jgi:thiol-disulfide isomerase/thioredoxin
VPALPGGRTDRSILSPWIRIDLGATAAGLAETRRKARERRPKERLVMTVKLLARLSLLVALIVATLPARGLAQDAQLAGRWDATVVVNKLEIPFVFEIAGAGPALKGSFFNGERRITSTSSRVENGQVILNFDQYASKLVMTFRDGQLSGEYQRARGAPYPVRAAKASANTQSQPSGPSIAGSWIFSAKSNKGETAFRFLARQTGSEVAATILRVDGDTGTLSGTWRDGRYVLSHFSGSRPLLLEVTPIDATTLRLKQNGQTEYTATRADVPRPKDAGEPTDPALHTSVKDPAEPFRFSFPDLNGQMVSNDDPRFRGKVVIVNIGGSWCPNCHDEAPFLSSLYDKYRSRGLEVVLLSFEEGDQLTNPTRLKAFIKEYGIKYTVLIPGEPESLNEKVPQGVNLNSFPTSFILGRDGRVRAVHAGFPSPGSGDFYTKAEHEVTSMVEKLLAERSPGTR